MTTRNPSLYDAHDEPPEVTEDGKRYLAKANGSTFGTSGTYLRSCYGCGGHYPVTTGHFRKVLGKSQFFHLDDCELLVGLKPRPKVPAVPESVAATAAS